MKAGAQPNKYYMRFFPVDLESNVLGNGSNFIRIDLALILAKADGYCISSL
jgi:hypothetical protein